jgi:hypothetical protein
MKRIFGSINLLLIFILVFNSCGQKDVFLDLEGPYLGQKPPGKEAELFAPGIISTKNQNEALLYGFGGHDLYISFRKQDNAMTEPVNLGKEINSSSNDWIPFVTSDGKYFFFTSNRAGNEDIYWVDATIIENLRSQEMK